MADELQLRTTLLITKELILRSRVHLLIHCHTKFEQANDGCSMDRARSFILVFLFHARYLKRMVYSGETAGQQPVICIRMIGSSSANVVISTCMTCYKIEGDVLVCSRNRNNRFSRSRVYDEVPCDLICRPF